MKLRVIFFEDDLDSYQRISGRVAGDEILPERFEPHRAVKKGALNGRHLVTTSVIRKHLLNPKETTLAVLDHDLTRYLPLVDGETVKDACSSIGVPLCVYTFQEGPDDRVAYLQDWRGPQVAIDVEEEPQRIAELITGYSEGFSELRSSFRGARKMSLSSIFKDVLRAPPEATPRLEQYLWSGVLPLGVLKASREVDPKFLGRIASTTFGYWICNTLLRFPGVLLNNVAAASYLGVNPEQFAQREDLRAPFKRALYKGPFSSTGPYWWTTEIDRIVAADAGTLPQTSPPGFGYLRGIDPEVKKCRCAAGHPGAGYYCVLTKKPVCDRHSIRPLGVIPVAADRSRILKKEFDRTPALVA